MPDLNAQIPADGVDAPEAATTNETPGVDASEATSESEQQPTDLEEARRGRDEAKARARDAEAKVDALTARIAELESAHTTNREQLERLQTQVRTTRSEQLQERVRASLSLKPITAEVMGVIVRASGVDLDADDFDMGAAVELVRKQVPQELIHIPKVPGANNGLALPAVKRNSAI